MFVHLSKPLGVLFLSIVLAPAAVAKDILHTQDIDQGLYSALLMSLLQPNTRIDRFDVFNPPPPDSSFQSRQAWPAKARAFQTDIWDRSMKYRKESFEVITNGKIRTGDYDFKRREYNFCLPQVVFLTRVNRTHGEKRKPGIVKLLSDQKQKYASCMGGKSRQNGYTVANGIKVSVPLNDADAEFVYNKTRKAKDLRGAIYCTQPENFFDEIHCHMQHWRVYDEASNRTIVEGRWTEGETWKITVGDEPTVNWALRSVNNL